MALDGEFDCLIFNKVLVLLVVSNCASNALLPAFSIGSLVVACKFVPPIEVTIEPALLTGTFIIIELLRAFSLGVDLAWYRGTAKFSSFGGNAKVALMGRLFERNISLVG